MTLREWLIVGGIVLVGLILFDGWRRMNSRRNRIRMAIDPSIQSTGSEEEESFNAELPNGGARKKRSLSDSELLASPATEAETDGNEPLLAASEAQFNARLDSEAQAITGMRADRDEELDIDLLDNGDLVSKPRAVIQSQSTVDPVSTDAEPTADQPVTDKPTAEMPQSATDQLAAESALGISPEPIAKLTEESEIRLETEPVSPSALVSAQQGGENDAAPIAPASVSDTDNEPVADVQSPPADEGTEAISPSAISDSEAEPDAPSEPSAAQPQTEPVAEPASRAGEVDDLFATSAMDFSRPIHELVDAGADETESVTKPKRQNRKTKPTQAPETGNLFDALLESVDREEPPLDDIDSLLSEPRPVAKRNEPQPEMASDQQYEAGSETLADPDSAAPGRVQRRVRSLDFSDPELSLVMMVVAPAGQRLSGQILRGIAEACGMEFGQMGLYHRFEDDSERSHIQFSMSDGVQPGTFDPASLDQYETPAVSLFMSLTEPRDPMYAFDCMLATAQTLAKNLHAQLLDGERSVLRPQTEEHYRERVRAYQLSQRAKSKRKV